MENEEIKIQSPGETTKEEKFKSFLRTHKILLIILIVIFLLVSSKLYIDTRQKEFLKEYNQQVLENRARSSSTPTSSPKATKEWSSTSSEARVGWSKFTNSKYHYSFEFPSWQGSDANILGSLLLLALQEGDTTNAVLQVQAYKTSSTLEDKYENDLKLKNKNIGYFSPPDGTVTLGNVNGLKALKTFECYQGGCTLETTFISGGNEYSFNLKVNPSMLDTLTNIYNESLSTFKFTQ